MQINCKLCGTQFICQLVGVDEKAKFAEVWRTFNLHVAKEHPEQAQPDSALLQVIAPAIAALRAFNVFADIQPEFGGYGYMMEIKEKQRKQLLDFADGITPTPDPPRVVPIMKGGKA